MTTMITFNELRQIKDMLPSGSMQKIADELGLDVETVRNYFGGDHYDEGKAVGLHIEQGPNGGIVKLDDTTILEKAKELAEEQYLIAAKAVEGLSEDLDGKERLIEIADFIIKRTH